MYFDIFKSSNKNKVIMYNFLFYYLDLIILILIKNKIKCVVWFCCLQDCKMNFAKHMLLVFQNTYLKIIFNKSASK